MSIQLSGEWLDPKQPQGKNNRMQGTLTIEDDAISLDLFRPQCDGWVKEYDQYDVLWGHVDSQPVSLFKCKDEEPIINFSPKRTMSVQYVLDGIWVRSLDDVTFDSCTVKFPYLRNWIFESSIHISNNDEKETVEIDFDTNTPIMNSEIEDGISVSFSKAVHRNKEKFKISIEEDTVLIIKSHNGLSIKKCFFLIREFTQFLSVALLGEQYPSFVTFKGCRNIDSPNNDSTQECQLLFIHKKSKKPSHLSFIKYDQLKNRIPDILRMWHEKYKTHAPISNYLIKSTSKVGIFDAPDFLIVEQALEGYHKRFNNNGNKDKRKLEDTLNIMINKFKSVDIIRKCDFDIKLIMDTRNYYSHFHPDDEIESKKLKVVPLGLDLFNLTQKCKILLACCILDILGLSFEEINICCKQSPLERILHNF